MKYATRLLDIEGKSVVLLQIEGEIITVAQSVTYDGRLFVYKANWCPSELTFREVTAPVDVNREQEIYLGEL
ncbi:hypothetical protein [Edaphovirga cremea]|uniref:hypothetical protein n=1 Tax=Edaphovirga cremea TaxID=2267246 RepID=UPI00398A2129